MRHLTNVMFFLLAIVLFTSCRPDSGPDTDCVCTEEYSPVFDQNGKKYANECKAICEGVSYSEFAPLTLGTIWFDTTQENAFCAWYIRINDKDYTFAGEVDKGLYQNGLVVKVIYKENLATTDNVCDWKDGRVMIDHIEIDE